MNPKAVQLAAVVATCLVIVTGVSRLLRPEPAVEKAPVRKSVVQNTSKKQAEQPCTIKRAAFGGTQTTLFKAMKGKVAHYIVLDRPVGNPMMPFYQQDWLEANYGPVKPAVVGEFSSVETAVLRAASLCRRN